MGKALFLGLSAAFFTAYSIVAGAVLHPSDKIISITAASDQCTTPPDPQHILLPGEPCYNKEVSRIPVIGSLLKGLSNIIDVATNLFSGFGQLVTFQAGLPQASAITLLIFIPLGFVNGYIFYSAIRGNS